MPPVTPPLLTIALVALTATGCMHGDCDDPGSSWLANAPHATRNRAGEPTIEIVGRAPNGGCGDIGGRTLVVITPSEIVIRERGAEEELPGPDPILADGVYDFDDAGVVVDMIWKPSTVEITIEDGRSMVVVECDAAIEGVPRCARR